MNIFSLLKKSVKLDSNSELLKLMIKKNSNFQEILNSNIFQSLRTQAQEIFFMKNLMYWSWLHILMMRLLVVGDQWNY